MKLEIIIFFAISLSIASCSNKTDQASDSEADLIEITRAQFDSEKMELGEPSLKPFSDVVYVTGTIVPSLDGHAQISVPISGSIIKIYCKPGQMVRKGSILFDVSGNDFIDLQKDFAESSANVSRLKRDFLRSQELYKDSIASQKDYISAESNYLAENARYMSLKIKLKSSGLDVSKIERGEFYFTYTIVAPINGFISNIDASIGKYVEPNYKIAEIVNDNSLQLRLSVFEKNSNEIKTGQKVVFYLGGNKTAKHNATITAVGKSITPENKSIECFAAIDNPQSLNLISNQLVECEVYVAVDSVLSVPETAINNSENDLYLLLYEKEANAIFYFKKIKVKTGRKANNYIELTEPLPSNRLLINGVYNIQVE